MLDVCSIQTGVHGYRKRAPNLKRAGTRGHWSRSEGGPSRSMRSQVHVPPSYSILSHSSWCSRTGRFVGAARGAACTTGAGAASMSGTGPPRRRRARRGRPAVPRCRAPHVAHAGADAAGLRRGRLPRQLSDRCRREPAARPPTASREDTVPRQRPLQRRHLRGEHRHDPGRTPRHTGYRHPSAPWPAAPFPGLRGAVRAGAGQPALSTPRGCCGFLSVVVQRFGDIVQWSDWEVPHAPAPSPPEFRFDAGQYEAEVARAAWCAVQTRVLAHFTETEPFS